MYHAIFDYAQSQRRELNRLAARRIWTQGAPGMDASPGTQLRNRVADALINLGTRLKSQVPTATGKFASRQQSPRWSR